MEKHRPKAQIVTQSSHSPLLMAGCGRCRLGIFSRGFNLKCAMQSSGQEQQEVPFFSTRKNHEGCKSGRVLQHLQQGHVGKQFTCNTF